MDIPNNVTETPRDHGHFWCRSTDVTGRDFTACATEFGDKGEECERISLTIHPRYSMWPDSPATKSGLNTIHANVVNNSISVDVGEVSIWLPAGHEQAVMDALGAAIAELDMQREAGTAEGACVVNLTGNVVLADAGWRREDDDTHTRLPEAAQQAYGNV